MTDSHRQSTFDPKPPRRPDGTLLPGHHGVGSEVGRIKDLARVRRDLNVSTMKALQKAFDRGGEQAINKVMRNNPAMFLKMLVLLVPRELEVQHSGGVKAMTTEQIERAIDMIKDMIAKRDAGKNAKVIEHSPPQVSSSTDILAKVRRTAKVRNRDYSKTKRKGKDMGTNSDSANTSIESKHDGG